MRPHGPPSPHKREKGFGEGEPIIQKPYYSSTKVARARCHQRERRALWPVGGRSRFGGRGIRRGGCGRLVLFGALRLRGQLCGARRFGFGGGERRQFVAEQARLRRFFRLGCARFRARRREAVAAMTVLTPP
jgi:hypothetical protein